MPEHWVDRLWVERIKEEIAFEKERGYLTYHAPEKGSVARGAHLHIIIHFGSSKWGKEILTQH
jgi:hypothetical protein